MSDASQPDEAQPPVARYPGALPFTDTGLDHQRFFGREEEANLLLHQLLSVELLVLFGKPGLGKTSLLNACIFEPLRKRDFLPLPVRFNHHNPALTPMQAFVAALQRTCAEQKIDYTQGSETRSLWELFKTAGFWRGERLQTPVLVLDQFEEIFNLQPEEFRRGAAAELGQLIGRRLPGHVREQLQAGQPLGFSEKPPEVKVLISLREDDLGLLEDLTPEIPSILQNRFRLTGLTDKDARGAIIGPAQLTAPGVRFNTEPFEYEEAAVGKMIDAARQKTSGIDPFFLQILCSYVEKQVRERQLKASGVITVRASDIGSDTDIDRISGEFYLDAINGLPPAAQESAKRLCEEFLLTTDGRRKSAPKEDIEKETGLGTDALDILEQKRLLRRESKYGSFYYEIAHDRLAQAIAAMRLPEEVRLEAQKRKEAEIAAKQARTAREAAEGIFDFVVFDLRDKLTARGEFSLLEDIQKGVIDYYEKMGATGETPSILRRKAVAYVTQGDLFENRGDLAAAFTFYQKSLEIRAYLAKLGPTDDLWQRDLSSDHFRIGGILRAQGELKSAFQSYETSLRILEKLVEEHPGWREDLSVAYRNIGINNRILGHLNTSLQFHRRSLDVLEKIIADQANADYSKSRLANTYDEIAEIQRAQGDFEGALRSHNRSQELAQMLVAADRNNHEWKLTLAVSYNGVGDFKSDQGEFQEALSDYGKLLRLIKELTAPDPNNLLRQRDLAPSYERIARVQRELGDLNSALTAYLRVVNILERLVRHDGTNADWQSDLASAYNSIGDVYRDQRNLPEALLVHRKALKIMETLVARTPEHIEWQRELGRSHHNIGEVLAYQNQLKDALASYEKGLEIRERAALVDSTYVECQTDCVETLWKISSVLERPDAADKKRAAANYSRALDILRPLAEGHRLKPKHREWIPVLERLSEALGRSAA
jgi:tetratricopeptide (TPR) repeat protein